MDQIVSITNSSNIYAELRKDKSIERILVQLCEYKEEMNQIIEEQRISNATEFEQLSRSHQIQCAALDSKVAETEKSIEKLVRDKKNLELTLSKDANEKVAELLKEISSLNTALEMKSTEMRELRHQNAKLQLKVEEIPLKDIEISKFKHRVNELKAIVDQKKLTEKVLTSKYEEMQRSVRSHVEKSATMIKEIDVLWYRIEEMYPSTSDSELANSIELSNESRSLTQSTILSPRAQERRTPQLASNRFSKSYNESISLPLEDSASNRSVVSVYLEQGRSRLPRPNVDTIYAPEGIYIANGENMATNLVLDSEHDADEDGSTPRWLDS